VLPTALHSPFATAGRCLLRTSQNILQAGNDKMVKNHPGRAVTQFQISSLMNAAYGKAATAGIATSGFRQTGIVPLNPDIFPDHLYAPADVTDQPEASEEVCCAVYYNYDRPNHLLFGLYKVLKNLILLASALFFTSLNMRKILR